MIKRIITISILLLFAWAALSCSGGGDSDPTSELISTSDVMTILKSLFPSLSEEEILELASSLSLDDIYALKEDLEESRDMALSLGEDLLDDAKDAVNTRISDLEGENDGYPETVEPVGRRAIYDTGSGQTLINMSGVFRNNDYVAITSENISITIDGQNQDLTTRCLYQGDTVDIIFLLDITGSMGPVITEVKKSVKKFVDIIVSSGIKGKLGVVTYQDTVGVNVDFHHPVPEKGLERSPFYAPVSIDDSTAISALQKFISELEANLGGDSPENLAGAIDFARNSIIGYLTSGEANTIGDGIEDPSGTEAFPPLTMDHQIFVIFTDISFHSDSRDSGNSSLRSDFLPRNISDILDSLHKTNTIVNSLDPSWVDKTTAPTGNSDEKEVDADFWAIQTGGVGEDIIKGYSIVDLELVIMAENEGFLDISLTNILASTCYTQFSYTDLTEDSQIDITVQEGGETFTESLSVVHY